jgi:RNA polymerase sigma-70 factor (ECF subfamily)
VIEDAADDAELVRLVRAGDTSSEAFGALYDRHKAAVFSFLVRWLRDAALAEDVLQETFFRAYANLETFDVSRSFGAWLYQVARNAATDALRVMKKGERLERAVAKPEQSDEDSAASTLSRHETLGEVREAFDALDDEPRALLIQRYGLEMKLEDLAQSFECTERTVRNRLYEAGTRLVEAILAGRGERS